jgi:predicted transport protein
MNNQINEIINNDKGFIPVGIKAMANAAKDTNQGRENKIIKSVQQRYYGYSCSCGMVCTSHEEQVTKLWIKLHVKKCPIAKGHIDFKEQTTVHLISKSK